MSPRLLVVTVALVAWWVISACNQVQSGALVARLRRHVPLGLIPLWTFFAPNPARADARLIWREERCGHWEAWRELSFGFAPPTLRWLWNPELTLNKAIADLVRSLQRVRPEMEKRTLLLSSAYVALLNVVATGVEGAGCSSIQFAVVRTSWQGLVRQLEVAFVSEVHDFLESGDDVR